MSNDERDPTGRNAKEAGAKLDDGKVRIGLVLNGFAKAIYEVSLVGTFGAQKYSDNGWLSVPRGIARYTDALYRHLNAQARGEKSDSDSGLYHAAHAAWNALAILELEIQKEEDLAKCRLNIERPKSRSCQTVSEIAAQFDMECG